MKCDFCGYIGHFLSVVRVWSKDTNQLVPKLACLDCE